MTLHFKLLGPSGLRVSEICLGTMSFGQDWDFGADEATSHRVLSAYADRGGNFLDTADKYHNGQTEEYIGRWLPGRRGRMVVATKYTLATDHSDPNSSGSHRKNLVQSVEASLRRLKTDYIDLLWVHAYDDATPFDETLRALDDVVRQGKVSYIGISDTPAWVVSAANVLAELRGWTQYVGLQVEYNLLARDVERDLIPMARHFGLSVTAWGPLAGGVLSGKYTRGGENDSRRTAGNERRGRSSERGLAIARLVDEIADELGASSAQVALAWLLATGYETIPIIGARKVSQLEDSLSAAELSLPQECFERLDAASRIPLGFPHDFLALDNVREMVKGEVGSKLLRPRPGR